jgi:hypothetical protein
MKRIRLRGVLFWAEASPVDKTVSPADSNTSERRIEISCGEAAMAATAAPGHRLVLLHDSFVTRPKEQAEVTGR